MQIVTNLVLFGLGILGLSLGANFLVRGSSALALRFHIRPIVIGLTVVAFGTSAPELVVSLAAAFTGKADVAIGNVVGSNIANIGLILGLTALLLPLTRKSKPALHEIPLLIFTSLLLVGLSIDGSIGRIDGVVLFGCLLFFLYESYRSGGVAEKVEVEPERPLHTDIGFVLMGLGGLVIGGYFLVSSATALARMAGISELVIGLTVVAFGTSMPELATSLTAVIKKQPDIGIGNIIGSNIFNTCCIMGIVPMVQPLNVNPDLLGFHYPIMIGFTLLVILLMRLSQTISRASGALLFLSFALYILVSYLR